MTARLFDLPAVGLSDVTLHAVSRAPIEKLLAYRRHMGSTFPWASSQGSDFNLDFQVGCTVEQQGSGSVEYNFTPRDTRASLAVADQSWARDISSGCGTDWATYIREQPGMSAFVLDDGIVYHTYSAYARGLDGLWGHVSVARSRFPRAQRRRTRPLVETPRRILGACTASDLLRRNDVPVHLHIFPNEGTRRLQCDRPHGHILLDADLHSAVGTE